MNSPISVLFLLPSLEVDRGERRIVSLARGLDRSRYRVIAAHAGAPGPLSRELESEGIAVHRLDSGARIDSPSVLRLFKLCRHERVRAIFSFGLEEGVAARVAGAAAGVSVRVLAGHPFPEGFGSPLKHHLNRVLEPLASAHLADSNAQRETLARAGRIPASKIAVIPPGIDPDGFMRPSSRGRMRASLGLPDGAEVAGVVAPLHPEEDHRTFLLAARFVVDELASARFLIVGAGPLEEDLRREIRALDLEGRAHLLGARSDVPEVLSALDLSVLVSRGANALPSSLLESMAAGLAIVGTDAGGVSEILENGVNGLLVRPRDAEGLARAMLELVRDPARSAHMGSASRRIVAERFTQAAMIARYEGLLERLLRLRRNPVRRS